MPFLAQQRILERPPETLPLLDFSNPITRAIASVIVPWNGRGVDPAVQAKRRLLVASSGTPFFSRLNGVTVSRGTVASGNLQQLSINIVSAGTDLSFGSVSLATGSIAKDRRCRMIEADGGGFTPLGFFEGDVTSAVWMADARFGGVGANLGGTFSQRVGHLDNLLLLHRNGVKQRLVVNGAFDPVESALTGNVQNGTSVAVRMSTNATLADALTVLWLRELSDAEARSWTHNPWQIFLPERQYHFFPAGGGTPVSAGTLANLEALQGLAQPRLINLGASGTIAPTIDLDFESGSVAQQAASNLFEALIRGSGEASPAVEALVRQAAATVPGFEAAGTLQTPAQVGFEAQGLALALSSASLEAIVSRLAVVAAAFETQGGVGRASAPGFEAAGALVVPVTVGLESLRGLLAAVSAPVEAGASAQRSVLVGYESLAPSTVGVLVSVPFEALQTLTQSRPLVFEALGTGVAIVNLVERTITFSVRVDKETFFAVRREVEGRFTVRLDEDVDF